MASAAGSVRLDVSELRRLLDERDDMVVLDVRSPGEYESVHLEGSVNFPLDLIEQHSAEVAARLAGPVVLLCARGVRSGQAARLLAGAGVDDLQVLDGGIGAWESAGGDVRRGRGRWAIERQVRLAAGSLVLTSILASTQRSAAKWVAAAIGAGLTYSALSDTCTMARVLGYLPYNRGAAAFDLGAAFSALR